MAARGHHPLCSAPPDAGLRASGASVLADPQERLSDKPFTAEETGARRRRWGDAQQKGPGSEPTSWRGQHCARPHPGEAAPLPRAREAPEVWETGGWGPGVPRGVSERTPRATRTGQRMWMGQEQTHQDATLCRAHDAAASAAHGRASASGSPPRFTGQPGAHSSSELRQVQEEAVCSRPSTSSGSLPGSPGPAPGLPPAVPLSIFILHESLALSPLQKVRHGKGSPLPKQLE